MAHEDGERPPVDWSLGSRGAVSSAVVGFLAVAAASVAGHFVDAEPYWAAGGTAAALLGSLVRSATANAKPSQVVFKVLRVLGAGGWATFVMAAGPTREGLLAFGVATAVSAAIAPFFETGPAATTTPGRAVVLRKTTRLAEEWEQRIFKVTNLRVAISEVSYWESGAGYTLFGSLPVGATRSALASHVEALAEAARLPNGCGIEVLSGDRRGLFVMNVATINRLTQDVPYPGKLEMGSINDPKPIGEYRDSTPVLVRLRETAGVVVGTRGTGKTTTLHGLTWAAGMNRDAVTCIIDLNGGALAVPWLAPWLDGTTDRPAIVWAAGDLEEAVALSEWLLEVLKDRKTTYAHLKLDSNSGLMPVGDGLIAPPAIELLVDEGAEALGSGVGDPLKKALRNNLEEIQRIGRDGAGNILASGLSATQDVMSKAMIRQARLRIAMQFEEWAEYSWLYGWNFKFTEDDLYGIGTGFIKTEDTPIRPWKSGNLLPDQIREAAAHMANHRPDLDAAAVAIGGKLFEQRLERMRARFTPGADLVPLPDDFLRRHSIELMSPVGRPAADRPVPATGETSSSRPDLTVLPGGAADILARYNVQPDRPLAPLHAEQVMSVTGGRTAEEAEVPPLLADLLALFTQHRAERLHSRMLAASLGMSQHELALMLRPLNIRPIPEVYVRGARARGYARTDIKQAATLVRLGQIQVPPEVAEWRVS